MDEPCGVTLTGGGGIEQERPLQATETALDQVNGGGEGRNRPGRAQRPSLQSQAMFAHERRAPRIACPLVDALGEDFLLAAGWGIAGVCRRPASGEMAQSNMHWRTYAQKKNSIGGDALRPCCRKKTLVCKNHLSRRSPKYAKLWGKIESRWWQ